MTKTIAGAAVAALAQAAAAPAADLNRTYHYLPDDRCMASLPGETTDGDAAHDKLAAVLLNRNGPGAAVEVKAADLNALIRAYALLRVESAIKDVFTYEGGDERRAYDKTMTVAKAYSLDDLMPEFDREPQGYRGFQGLKD